MIKKIILLTAILTSFLWTTIGCSGQLKNYESFGKERIELLKDFYSLDFPEDVKYVKAIFESARDNSFRLIIKYLHKDFESFIIKYSTTYVSTEGQNFGIFTSTIYNYNSTPYYSPETQTYICFSTSNGVEYVELYSTRYFEYINKFNKNK